ncbi:MAG: tetratricopeptide repeat protein [Bdellovibrionales bacterium]|nr:tetratricopeptide repeat protein [Bdellovibrionales bacterium]
MYAFLFAQAQVAFSGVDEAELKVSLMMIKVEKQKVRTAMVQMQFDEFRNYVSRNLPQKIPVNNEEAYPLRQLASVLKTSDSYKLKLVKASSLMSRGKALFEAEEYSKANTNFKKVIDYYSFSHHLIEAHYMYAESLYLQSDYERCVDVVKRMIELFPDNELTGHAMLRLGMVFEAERRSTEALEVYNTVLSTFPQRSLASKANQAIRELEL